MMAHSGGRRGATPTRNLGRALGVYVGGPQIDPLQRPRILVRTSGLVFVRPEQISSLCAEEAAAQEQTGQVEECLKVNLLKIKTELCKKVTTFPHFLSSPLSLFPFNAIVCTF